MTDYESELEALAPCKELLFNGTPGFGRYAPLLSHAVGHPAKMNTRLTEFLILELTKPGDVILDPMSGTAQTGLIASINSRDAVCVELETKFHNWQIEAKRKLDAYQTFTVKGALSCIQGDARKLSELLQTVDAVVTSPPYSDMKKGKLDPEDWANRMEKFGSTPESRRERHTPGRLKAAQSMSEGYSESPDNIGNLPMGEITAIITSPPYEKTVKDHGKSERATKINREKNNTAIFSYNADNPDNIGNKAKETYLEAMLQVYREMFQVLKEGGVAAVIVKPFIRNRQVVDLPYQTWLLLQKCGFELIKIYKQRLDQQSFWRVLYMQKNPNVPQIWHEWVLVCKKPVAPELLVFSSSDSNCKKEERIC